MMQKISKWMRWQGAFYGILLSISAQADNLPNIKSFSPNGVAKNVEQVLVEFSTPMVPFGNVSDQLIPFHVDCPVEGVARWVDPKNWVYEFPNSLAAGVSCKFGLRRNIRDLKGKKFIGERFFTFSTGGPKITKSYPRANSISINEKQIFILKIDGKVDLTTVRESVFFSTEKTVDPINVRIVEGEQRRKVLQTLYEYKNKLDSEFVRDRILLIQGIQSFPAGFKIKLHWGTGVKSKSGIPSHVEQILSYQVRPDFTIGVSCTRENSRADCIPLAPIRVTFSAPVPWKFAKQIALKSQDGVVLQPVVESSYSDSSVVSWIRFRSPFPAKTEFTVNISPDLSDDSQRKPVNSDRFPLKISVGEYPPLLKFSGKFGVLEASNPILPITVRNLTEDLETKVFSLAAKKSFKGKLTNLSPKTALELIQWLKKLEQKKRNKSIFEDMDVETEEIEIPRLYGDKAFEVVGIPLKKKGIYVLELESPKLGEALLSEYEKDISDSFYVNTIVLVTDLAVHFKWGVEKSAVWVTRLSTGTPVVNAKIRIYGCDGKLHWKGRSDATGVAIVAKLPWKNDLSKCPLDAESRYAPRELMITASYKDDFSFVMSQWNDGIESWRFQVASNYLEHMPIQAHTVLARNLVRAGETIHMKHFIRKHSQNGFSFVKDFEYPNQISIKHYGSSQTYIISPIKWEKAAGTAISEWKIPKEAKLGTYYISLQKLKDGKLVTSYASSRFHVQEFKVPLLKATLQIQDKELIRPLAINLQADVRYLNGGSAQGLPIKFRHIFEKRPFRAKDFEGFRFINGSVEKDPIKFELFSVDLKLDNSGGVKIPIGSFPNVDHMLQLRSELEFRDPSGQIQTKVELMPVFPSSQLIGIKPNTWTLTKAKINFKVAVVSPDGKPIKNAAVRVKMLKSTLYSHRKRLVGGFYAYESHREITPVGEACSGKTNAKGILNCSASTKESGNIYLEGEVVDQQGRVSKTHESVWVASGEEWWFAGENHDRMDVIPEKKFYNPGDKIKLQIRMPFKTATVLVAVEREGVMDTYVKKISRKSPVIEIPVKKNYGPNVFISVLAVRGRIGVHQPTAIIDLGKPAFKLGITEVKVGWDKYKLNVAVVPEKKNFKVREKAKVRIYVKDFKNKKPIKNANVMIAAIDEGLLELMPNNTWDLLKSMLGQRAYLVHNSTMQMNVVGKRHFGLKALPTGGDGGRSTTRELFDTLLYWKGDVKTNAAGIVDVEIPINDSLTGFRIVAVASKGTSRFGMDSDSIRTSQDIILISGIPQFVRQGDKLSISFTIRNTTKKSKKIRVNGEIIEQKKAFQARSILLRGGESRDIVWQMEVPNNVSKLTYQLKARYKKKSHFDYACG